MKVSAAALVAALSTASAKWTQDKKGAFSLKTEEQGEWAREFGNEMRDDMPWEGEMTMDSWGSNYEDFYEDIESGDLDAVLGAMYGCVEEVKFMCYSDELFEDELWGFDVFEDEDYDDIERDDKFEEWLDETLNDWDADPDYRYDEGADYEPYHPVGDGGWRKLKSTGWSGLLNTAVSQDTLESNEISDEDRLESAVDDLRHQISNAHDIRHQRKPQVRKGDRVKNRSGGSMQLEMKAALNQLLEEDGDITKEELKNRLKDLFREARTERPDGEVPPLRVFDGKTGEPPPHERPHNGHKGLGNRPHGPGPDGSHERNGPHGPDHRGGEGAPHRDGDDRALLSEDTLAARSEIRAFIQEMVQEGDSKEEIRMKVEQRMEEQPELKALMMKKMEFLRRGGEGKRTGEGGHRYGGGRFPLHGKHAGDHGGRLDRMYNKPFHHGDYRHGMDRKLMRFEKKHGRGMQNCPNGDIDWLLDNLTPQCADILFRLDAFAPPPPMMDFFPFEGGHHGGHHGGLHHRGPFDRHRGHFRGSRHGAGGPPPPAHLACTFFGVVFVLGMSLLCLRRCRMRRNRMQVVRGQVVNDGRPIVPNGTPAGLMVQTSQNMTSSDGFGQQPQIVNGSGAPMLATYPTNCGEQKNAPSSIVPASGGAPIVADGKTYAFAPAPQLSF